MGATKVARLRFSLATSLVSDISIRSDQSRVVVRNEREIPLESRSSRSYQLSLHFYDEKMGSGASRPDQEINPGGDQTFFANRDSPVQVSSPFHLLSRI